MEKARRVCEAVNAPYDPQAYELLLLLPRVLLFVCSCLCVRVCVCACANVHVLMRAWPALLYSRAALCLLVYVHIINGIETMKTQCSQRREERQETEVLGSSCWRFCQLQHRLVFYSLFRTGSSCRNACHNRLSQREIHASPWKTESSSTLQ